MKKLWIIMAVCLLLTGVCGCNAETAANDNAEADAPKTTTTGSSTTVPSTTEPAASLLGATFKVPMYNVYVDVPDFHMLEEGYTTIFLDGATKYTTFTCMYRDSAESLTEAYEKTSAKYLEGIRDHHMITGMGDITQTTEQVNGMDVLKIEGNIIAGQDYQYDAYICGYAFIYQNYPCAIFGVVLDDAQPQDQIDLIKQIVDEMMLSVRSSR